jgi:hypothetical protein
MRPSFPKKSLVVTVIGAEVSGENLFTVGDLTKAHGLLASSAFCGCHVVCCVVTMVVTVEPVLVLVIDCYK